jgi:hypothetical protein
MADLLEHLKAALTDRYATERELGASRMATGIHPTRDSKHGRRFSPTVPSHHPKDNRRWEVKTYD